jgi:hypothetical protein
MVYYSMSSKPWRKHMNTRTKRRIVERKIVEKLLEGTGVNRICRELKVGKRRVQDTRQRALAGYCSPAAARGIHSNINVLHAPRYSTPSFTYSNLAAPRFE